MMTYPYIDLSIYWTPISPDDVGSAPELRRRNYRNTMGYIYYPTAPPPLTSPLYVVVSVSLVGPTIVYRISIIDAYRYRSSLTTL